MRRVAELVGLQEEMLRRRCSGHSREGKQRASVEERRAREQEPHAGRP